LNNKEIFEDNIFDLPIIRHNNDLISFVENLFETFQKKINLFDGELANKLNTKKAIIEEECSLINEALRLYYGGKISLAYEKIHKCIELLEKESLLEISSASNDFFRIRISANKNLGKGDLFHIPFQLREKVSTQRYSIPGLPCLYIADSIFVAWEELDRPKFDDIHVSRFNLSDSDLNILYFSVTSQEMRERCFKGSKIQHIAQLVKFLSYWPLLSVCSLRVLKRDDVFKPEYIIPQMVLQYVLTNSKIDGIQFKSNRILPSVHNVGSFNNIVIPIQKFQATGYCSFLASKIKLTSPLSWGLLDISDPERSFLKKRQKDILIEDISRAYYIEVITGQKTNYIESKFGILEEKLRTMPDDYL